MGIKELLKKLEPVTKRGVPLSHYAGKTVAIDVASWLYRGAYSCAVELALGEPTTGYLDYVMHRICILQSHGIRPIVVFDGRRSPLKAETYRKRRSSRKKKMQAGHRLLKTAQALPQEQDVEKMRLRDSARSHFQKAIHVTREMMMRVAERLKSREVEIMVAPYEADAQVAFLCRERLADVVMSEDSDILIYSALAGAQSRPPFPVLFKFDERMQTCEEIVFDPKAMSRVEARGDVNIDFIYNLASLSRSQGARMFVQACVLGGCDYIDSVKGVGLKSAFDLVWKCKRSESENRLDRVIKLLRQNHKTIPEEYLKRVKRAEALFYYHWCFCPRTQRCVMYMTPPSMDGELLKEQQLLDLPALEAQDIDATLGQQLNPEDVVGVAEARLDPETLEDITALLRPAPFPPTHSVDGLARGFIPPSLPPARAPARVEEPRAGHAKPSLGATTVFMFSTAGQAYVPVSFGRRSAGHRLYPNPVGEVLEEDGTRGDMLIDRSGLAAVCAAVRRDNRKRRRDEAGCDVSYEVVEVEDEEDEPRESSSSCCLREGEEGSSEAWDLYDVPASQDVIEQSPLQHRKGGPPLNPFPIIHDRHSETHSGPEQHIPSLLSEQAPKEVSPNLLHLLPPMKESPARRSQAPPRRKGMQGLLKFFQTATTDRPTAAGIATRQQDSRPGASTKAAKKAKATTLLHFFSKS